MVSTQRTWAGPLYARSRKPDIKLTSVTTTVTAACFRCLPCRAAWRSFCTCLATGTNWTVELLAKNTGIDAPILEDVLGRMSKFSIIGSLEIETLEGITKVYDIHENGSYIPFLYLARHMTDAPDMNYVNINMKNKPLL